MPQNASIQMVPQGQVIFIYLTGTKEFRLKWIKDLSTRTGASIRKTYKCYTKNTQLPSLSRGSAGAPRQALDWPVLPFSLHQYSPSFLFSLRTTSAITFLRTAKLFEVRKSLYLKQGTSKYFLCLRQCNAISH